MMFCPSCGYQTEEGAAFCSRCGKALPGNTTAAGAQQQASVQPEIPPVPHYMPPRNGYYPQAQNEDPEGNPAFGVVSLVTGILAFLIGYFPIIPILLELPAIILGIVGIKKNGGKGMAIAGLVLGSIALLTTILMTVLFIALIAAGEMVMEYEMMF